MANNELAHWGIKGMRWGIRRYQNKDGSLTPAGKKRYNEEMERAENERKELNRKQRTNAKIRKLNALQDANAELKKRLQEESDALDPKKVAAKEKAEAKAEKKARKLIEKAEKAELKKLKKAEEAEEAELKALKKAEEEAEKHHKQAVENSKTKSYKDMTDEELMIATNRLRLERAYMESLPPKQVSEGKKLLMRVLENKLIPTAIDFGKDALKDVMTKKLKDDTGVDLDKLAETGSLDDVAANLSKMNSTQVKTAKNRLANIEAISKLQRLQNAMSTNVNDVSSDTVDIGRSFAHIFDDDELDNDD